MMDWLISQLGVDLSLLKGCPAYERRRYVCLSLCIALLVMGLVWATGYIVLDIMLVRNESSTADHIIAWITAGAYGLITAILSISVYRLMLCSEFKISATVERLRGMTNQLITYTGKLFFALLFGSWFGVALCHFILGAGTEGQLSFAHERRLTQEHLRHVGQRGDELDEMYFKLGKLKANIAIAPPQASAADSGSKNKSMQELQVEKISSEINAFRKAEQAKQLALVQRYANTNGFLSTLMCIYKIDPGLFNLIMLVVTFIYCVPVLILSKGYRGPYSYFVEYDTFLRLAKHRIVPKAELVWVSEKQHHIDKFLAPENIQSREATRLEKTKMAIEKGLSACIKEKSAQFSQGR